MARCSVCGNDYQRAFRVQGADGEQYTFDSIECAAHRIAPICAHCNCRVLGHGVEVDGTIYCCANCAREVGAEGVRDNA